MVTVTENQNADYIEIEQIIEMIPHRYPFLMIDRVVKIVPGKSAIGIKNVTINEPYFKGHFLIILPQALKISIPGSVNTFIGLYKDTTLVLIIGMLDPLGIGRASLADAVWAGLAREVYFFIALFFFICCFGMSRYSLYLEKKLDTEHI